MVQVGRGFYEDEPSFRRCSTRGSDYSLGNDRDHPSTTLHTNYDVGRMQSASTHDVRQRENSAERDANARPRSRIPVACQRCRKRKIRCSGDNGGACSNCKSAGCQDQCQFLRVQSQDIPMKTDALAAEFFDPSMSENRLQCRNIPQGSQYQTTAQVGYDSYLYRNNSIPSYQTYPGKSYYSNVPGYTDFEGPADYGLQNSPYQLMVSDHLRSSSPSSTYEASSQTRGWESVPHLNKNSPIQLDQLQPLFNNQMSYVNNGSIPFRQTIQSDSNGFNASGASCLPTLATAGMNDRPLLPIPPANRPGPLSSFLRTHGTSAPTTQRSNYESFNQSYLTANILNSFKAQSQSATPENPSFSISTTSPSPESLAYSEGPNSSPVDLHNQSGLYDRSEHLSYDLDSSSNNSYRHGSRGSLLQRTLQGSNATGQGGPLAGVVEGELSSGHQYVPYHNGSSAYPAPALGVPTLPPVRRRTSIQPL